MNTKNKCYLVVLIVLAVTAAFFFFKKHGQSGSVESEVKSNLQVLTNTALINAKPTTLNISTTVTGRITNQIVKNRLEELRANLEERNVPISFYGKVVDQNSNEISDAQVILHVIQPRFDATKIVTDNVPRFERVTDSKGHFNLNDTTGNSLTIESITKDGYRLSSKTKTIYGYGDVAKPHHPDPQNPVIIRMWKLGELGKTISRRIFWDIASDGQPCTIDLVADKKSNGENTSGDLVVKLTRPPNIKPHDRYPWTIELSAVNGGLVETQAEFLYSAPEAGYQPTIMIQMNPESSDWTSVLKKDFYISSRSGSVFGALHLTVRPNYGEASAIQIEATLNPNGSRNLQP